MSEKRNNRWWEDMREEQEKSHGRDRKNRNRNDSSSSKQNSDDSNGYLESDAVKALREQMEIQLGLKPADYVSQWQPHIDGMLNDILNRKDFQYDLNADALYQMYKDQYLNLGQKAMMDTVGQAAALTGGYGNSYAQTAGQQVFQNYMLGLTDKIPELYQIALDRYNQQGQDLYQKYGLLNTQEQNAYDRWRDTFDRWVTERDFSTGRYDTERGFDYGTYRDTVTDEQWAKEFAEQKRQWQAQFEEDIRRWEHENGIGVGSSSGSGGSSGGSGSSGSGGGGGGSSASYDVGTKNGQLALRSSANAAANAAYQNGSITKEQYDQIRENNRQVR